VTPPFHLLETPLGPGVTLLEASAGTGKTYALAAIYLRLVAEEDIPVGRIAVTTYTIPATAELRERIRARLAEAVAAFDGAPAETPFVNDLVARHAGDATFRRRLTDAMRDFDEACISTIHGFCQRLLRERSFESGADPEAELLPDQSALVREVADDFWRRHFSGARPGATPLALLARLTPDALARLYGVAISQPTATLVPAATEFPQAQATAIALMATFRAQWPAWREGVRRIFIERPDWAKGAWKNAPEATASSFALIEQLSTDPVASLACYEAIEHFRPGHIQEAGGLRAHHRLPSHPFLQWCEDFAAAANHFAAATRAQFLTWARGELAQRKIARGVMAFDDLLTRLGAALEGPGGADLAAAVRERFAAALVDEFQDTDPTQDAIFRKLFAESPAHRLFLIGDPKQAIYGFRGADIHTYLEARERAARRYALDTNYRSDAPLVAAVNHLFERPSVPFMDPRVTFESAVAARAETERPLKIDGSTHAPLRFWFWDEEEAIPAGRAGYELPYVTAKAIEALMARGTLDGQPLQPRDLAVLCARNDQCQQVQAALAERGIAAVVLSNSSVFHSREADELHLVLAAVARPTNEPALRAALATSLFGLDAAALDALGDDVAGWEAQLARFAEAHARWRDRGFIQMFRELLRDVHARARLLGLPSGERRLTNFLHLAELLHATARELNLGPAALVRWFAAELNSSAGGEERELRLESDDDAVKVLTVHKSKGLEWPVVFCPFLWTKADLRDTPHTLYHDASGQPVLDLGTPGRDDARRIAGHEQLAEQLRLLYVALTRARHQCHVVWGRFNQGENSALMWLLEPPPEAVPNGPEALAAHAGAFDSAHLRATLESLAAQHPECISVEPLPDPGPPPTTPRTEDSPATRSLAAREFRGHIDGSWRINSFSSLTAGAEQEHDRDADDRPRVEQGSLRGIHAFPRGAKAGVCLHEIFEKLDFTKDGDVEATVIEKLRQHDLHTPEQVSAVSECIRRTLAAPMAGTALRAIPTTRILRELEFHLPAKMLTAAQLTEFAGTGLRFEARRGILKGYIDLIFEHEGQFHIVDWKSNWLGTTHEDYTAAGMEAEMARKSYALQWRLYQVALHRFLALRLRDYAPEKHLGGAHYVFLRGVTPGRPELGIVSAPLDPAALAKLDQLFST
jgi:exodeoxyribonuclease V beta subunit